MGKRHLIVLSVVMDEMDGSPEDSAEILLHRMHNDYEHPYQVLVDYLDADMVLVSAEEA